MLGLGDGDSATYSVLLCAASEMINVELSLQFSSARAPLQMRMAYSRDMNDEPSIFAGTSHT
jgi:hypothetical protein